VGLWESDLRGPLKFEDFSIGSIGAKKIWAWTLKFSFVNRSRNMLELLRTFAMGFSKLV
jgi:hypothetical protein